MARVMRGPVGLAFLSAAADFSAVGLIGPPLRPLAVFAFLLIGPGCAYIQLLKVKDRFACVTLTIALSLAIDTLVAEFLLLCGWWSPALCLAILTGVSLIGAACQFLAPPVRRNTGVTSSSDSSLTAV